MTPGPHVLIEVCVDSVASAIAAERGGADRLELCSSLIEGGVTPSSGLIENIRAAVSLPVHIMIRPRGGDFCYDSDEFEVMRWDIMHAKKQGANGVVFGVLIANGQVDCDRTRQLVELSRPLSVTFHRAFDMSADLFRALEDVCTTGVDRLLTSGGKLTALQGSENIAQLVLKVQNRIAVMAGSGIKPHNAAQLVRATGVSEVHVGLRTSRPSPMVHSNSCVSMGTAEGREYQRFGVREEDVRDLRMALTDKS